MYLLLSRHGIWYYRKSYVLDSGKRKEIRRSLATKDKREAKLLVAKLNSSTYSSEIGQVLTNSIQQDKIPSIDLCISSYIKENSHLWQERHRRRIEKVLFEIPTVHLRKSDVSRIKKSWVGKKSIATVNKCIGYCSMFFKWLQTEYDGIILMHILFSPVSLSH